MFTFLILLVGCMFAPVGKQNICKYNWNIFTLFLYSFLAKTFKFMCRQILVQRRYKAN